MDGLTPADRMALAVCTSNPYDPEPCLEICSTCRRQAAAVAHEIAAILRERHGGSSTTADWLDGVGGGQPVPSSERLTVKEIADLPEHGYNYIYADGSDEIQLDGYFTRAQLLQLANSTYG